MNELTKRPPCAKPSMFATNACDVGAEAVARLLLTNSTIQELEYVNPTPKRRSGRFGKGDLEGRFGGVIEKGKGEVGWEPSMLKAPRARRRPPPCARSPCSRIPHAFAHPRSLIRTLARSACSIRHNHITDVGGQAILTSLADNRSLTAIQYASYSAVPPPSQPLPRPFQAPSQPLS